MQYKVMYQQRAGRVYYIDAKKAWGDEWTHVATVNLANMNANAVTTFANLNADFADAGKFFRVRAALGDHVSNNPNDYPVVVPNMLVANRGAVIDLSDGKTLDLGSFDTDATDPGTVWVKVAVDTAPGTTLIRAPKAAEKSLKACKPKDCGDISFEVGEEDGKLVLKVAGNMPAVEGGKGSVTVEDEKIVVAPNEGVTDITLVNVGEKQVEIPPSVEKIIGVSDCKKLTVRSGTHDVTKAMKFTPADGGFKIELDGTAVVMVGDEEIPVEPTLADGTDETPFALKDGQFVFNVKTIPGLKYTVQVSDTLDPGGFGSSGQPMGALSSRCELTVDRPSGKKQGFYKIQVSR